MSSRVCAPDGAIREIDGQSGFRYSSSDGVYDMSDRDAKRLVALGGFRPSLVKVTRHGYRCQTCGFRPYFRTCSRCGSDCDREA